MSVTSQGPQRHPAAGISVSAWGTAEGKPASLWTLDSGSGMRLRATNYGTIVTELHVPDRDGRPVDVVLGCATPDDYADRSPYFGCTVGRCANRIAAGRFAIDGRMIAVTRNDGPNCLHGGARGFDKALWQGKAALDQGMPQLVFTHTSPDGEEGFPGTVTARVTYTLTPRNELRIDMSATTDAPTVVSLAHHGYWNLGGHRSGRILDHELHLPASHYTPADAALITTGAILPVDATPLDFRVAKPIGRDIGAMATQAGDPGGYDHNWCIDGADGTLRPVAALRSPATGITLHLSSNQPGIQVYTGNFLDGIVGKDGAVYRRHDGLCLETQAYPDSVNKQGRPGWPDVILRPGRVYDHRMVHRFAVA